MSTMLRWAVVGTMDEPASLIITWVAHHLMLGATEVHVYLDRPNAEVVDTLADVPNTFITLCDAEYWANSHRRARPIRHTARQKHNATHVYKTRNVDWVLHCDADEFLHMTGDFRKELGETEARTLRMRNIERTRQTKCDFIFAGGFRGPVNDKQLLERVYGRWGPFLEGGMAGYKDGKDIVRSGEAFSMGVHFPIDSATNARHTDPYVELNSACLLHFDGLTPLHNVLKLLKRATEPKYQIPRKFGAQRERQFRFANNHVAKPMQMRKMIDGVFGLTDRQVDALGAAFSKIDFDPRPALDALGLKVDLSGDAFDTVLRAREAELIEATGLRF